MNEKRNNLRARAQKDDEILGQSLRGLRMARGLSQSTVANSLGLSYQQLQKYETGANRIPVAALMRLRRLYGVSYDSIFAGVDSDHNGAPPDAEAFGFAWRIAGVEDEALRRKIGRVVMILCS